MLSGLLKSSYSFLLISIALLLSSSLTTIMLGWLSDTKEVGLFSAAYRIAMLTSFLLQITVSVFAPKIAALYSQGLINDLKVTVHRITASLGIIGIMGFIISFICGSKILSFWGRDFMEAYYILVILSFGQLLNIASGPVVYLLTMTGNEKVIRNIIISTTAVSLVLNLMLITKFKAIGAAIAFVITTLLNMSIGTFYIKKKLGFFPIKLLDKSEKSEN